MSRPKRMAAIAEALHDAASQAEELRDEYQDWRDNIPDNLDESPVAEKLDAAIEALEMAIEAGMAGDELDTVDPPRGFGKD